MAGACRRVHPSRLHAPGQHAAGAARPFRRLAVPLPWLAICRCRARARRTGATESRGSALRVSDRDAHQGWLGKRSMEGPAYTPSSRLSRWLDSRLPLIRFAQEHVAWYPTPRNLNVWYVFGGILTTILAIQIITGIVLAMHYTPDSTLAFDSVEHIMRDVNAGWLLRYLHSNGASMFFIAVYIHIFRGLYYGSYKAPRELIWIIGVLIYIVMMATAFLGYTLPWGQMSFWGATVITNFFSALNALIPHLGDVIVTWLWGGFGVDNATLHRFFSLHYLLPFVLAALVALHVWALHVP